MSDFAYKDCMETHKEYFQKVANYFEMWGCGDSDVWGQETIESQVEDSFDIRDIASVVALMSWQANGNSVNPEDIEVYSPWWEMLRCATIISQDLTIKKIANILNIDEDSLWNILLYPEDNEIQGSITIKEVE